MKGATAAALLVAVALQGATAVYMPSFSSLTAGQWNYIVPGGDTGCALGDSFGFLVKKGATSPGKVMIEFEGGGSCYSWESCGNDDEAAQGSEVAYSVKMLGLTNQISEDLEDDDNLAFPGLMGLGQEESGDGIFDGWTKIWVPHCTQDMHIGARTAVYEDENDDDNNNKDDDDDGDGDEDEDRSITWNHNGLANAQSAVDYISNSISTSQVFMTGCGLQPITAGHWSKKINSQTGTEVTVLSDSGVGLLPSSWVQNYMSNWGAGCVVSQLLNNNGGSADTSSDNFWTNTFTVERLWEFVPASNSNVKWMVWADVADGYSQEVYNEMNGDEEQKNDNEGYWSIKAATILQTAQQTGNVNMMLIHSEQEDDENENDENENDENENDGDEDDGDEDDGGDDDQKSQKSQKSQKNQDNAQCYQAGYNAMQLENGDGDGEGDGEGEGENANDGTTTFSTWVKNALSGDYTSVVCQYCVPDNLEDCQGNIGGNVLPDACGTCPEAEEDNNGEEEDNNDDDDDDNGDEDKENKDDDDDGDGDGEGEGEGEGEYSCTISAPAWYKSSCTLPNFQETSGRRSDANSGSSHTSLAIFGGVVIAAVLAFFAFVNFKGNKGEKRRLVDVEKGNNPTY